MPTRRPAVLSMCVIRRAVVVLPLVPVTAIAGTRPSSPWPNRCAMMASPTLRPLPNEGVRCMRRPGAAFTSTMPPCCCSSGSSTDCATRSTPQTCRPTVCAAATAQAAMSGCTSSVTSVAVPPVLRLALLRRITRLPLTGTASGVRPCRPRRATAMSSKRILVSEVAWPSPRRGSLLTLSTSCFTVSTPSPITCGGSRRAAATRRSPTTSRRKSLPGR